ncbi:MAG: transcriptional repressor [Oscillospiraceae bacterium]
MKQRRNTQQRQLVLDAVRARYDHPSADTIYTDVVAIDPKISRGTVYRNLNVLDESGELLHVKVPDGPDRFDLRTEPHYHILCSACGAVADVALPYSAELDAVAAGSSGFHVTRHYTVFEGLCPDCQSKKHVS